MKIGKRIKEKEKHNLNNPKKNQERELLFTMKREHTK